MQLIYAFGGQRKRVTSGDFRQLLAENSDFRRERARKGKKWLETAKKTEDQQKRARNSKN